MVATGQGMMWVTICGKAPPNNTETSGYAAYFSFF